MTTLLITIWLAIGFAGALYIRLAKESYEEKFELYAWICLVIIGTQATLILLIAQHLCKALPNPLKKLFMWEI